MSERGNTLRYLLILLALFCMERVNAEIKVAVEIHGVNAEMEKNIRLYLSLEQQLNIVKIGEVRLRLLHKRAIREIQRALQPFGHYHATVKSELRKSKFLSTNQNWLAVYTVNAGPPVMIDEYEFAISKTMGSDPEFKKLIKKNTLAVGEIFSHVKYEKFKEKLTSLAAERGYFEARFAQHQVEINLEANTAKVRLFYKGGERYGFGEVLLKQDVLEPDLLKRYIFFKKGDPYTFSALLELQQSLSDSDYFNTVDVLSEQAVTDRNEIPVTILLTPRKRNRYSLGVGYGSDTLARAKFGWEIPQFNRDGHRIKTEAKISERGYSLSTQYRVPVFDPRSDQLVYSASVENELTDIKESTVRNVGVSLNYSRGYWRETLALNYQQEASIIASEPEQRSRLLIPGINWTRIWGKELIFILDGLKFDVSIRGATESLFSDNSFIQIQGGLKGINPLGNSNRLIAYGRLGSTWIDRDKVFPTSIRFFAGGSNSVRGYGYETLGPLNSKGEVVGGQYLMVGSLELEHSFNSSWGAAIFIDAGSAIDDFDDKLARGAGFGVRWNSPIGPVRVDVANALSRDDRPWRLHITIGPDL